MTGEACFLLKDTYRYKDKLKTKPDAICNLDYQNRRIEKINENPNSIILVGGRLPLILSEHHFDNKEGGIENKGSFHRKWENKDGKTINQAIKDSMLELMNEGHKIILMYPIPEVGWHVPNKLFKDLPKKQMNVSEMNDWLDKNRITTSYEVYKQRAQSSFELLDSINHPNLHRVYPHKLFCDKQIKGRCITHDDKNIFYADDDHPSNEGAKLINNLIIDKLKEINNP